MNIGIYPRKSVYRDNSDSIDVQVNLCKEYAELVYRGQELNFIIYDGDEGFSGKNTNRPAFTRMMKDVRQGLLNAVIVYKLDRISRNVQDFSATFSILQEYDVAFVSVKESFDTSTPIGRTVMYILAAFAQLEREQISIRVADNMQALGAAGKWTGGMLPAGMTSIKKTMNGKQHSYLMVDPVKIKPVKKIYELFLSGYTLTGLERYCRDNGIHTQAGKFMSATQIYALLTNPIYAQNSEEMYDYLQEKGCSLPERGLFDGDKGLIAYGRTRNNATTQKRQKENKWIIAVGIHEYVIDSQKWIAVQKRMGINKQVRSNKYQVGLLKGVLKCKCGGSMINRVYQKNGLQFEYYVCVNRDRKGSGFCNAAHVRINNIDELFLKQLKILSLDKEHIRLDSQIYAEEENDIERIREDMQSLQSKIKNLTIALQENMQSVASRYLVEQIEVLDKQYSSLSRKLLNANRVNAAKAAYQNNVDNVYQGICYLIHNFDILSYEEKNELIRRTVKKCVLDEGNLQIIF